MPAHGMLSAGVRYGDMVYGISINPIYCFEILYLFGFRISWMLRFLYFN